MMELFCYIKDEGKTIIGKICKRAFFFNESYILGSQILTNFNYAITSLLINKKRARMITT